MRTRTIAATVVLAIIMLTGSAMVASTPATAQEPLIVPIDTVVRSAPGELTVLASSPIPADLIGMTCTVSAEAYNQSSRHPGNDILVRTDGDEVILSDVEREPGAVTSASADVVLGDTVTLTLRMGGDGVFSGGVTVTFACVPPTTTTEATTTTSTQPTTTTEAPTTTTEASTTTTEATTTTAVESTTQATQASTTTTDVEVKGEQVERDVLPFTGVGAGIAALVAFGLLGAGLAVRRVAN